MGKKCIPGIICIENMKLFILFLLFVMVGYLYYTKSQSPTIYIVSPSSTTLPINMSLSSNHQLVDTLNDAYSPPLKNDGMYFPDDMGNIRSSIDIRGQPAIAPTAIVPINIQTRGYSASYTQIGILTRTKGGDMILPLMGRRIMNGRSKLQYYTISNTGSVNTKLPISVNGKSCSGEYGCDEMSNGDTVYVEGYNDIFKATIYENNMFSYLPVV